jgi:hypothetical protein
MTLPMKYGYWAAMDSLDRGSEILGAVGVHQWWPDSFLDPRMPGTKKRAQRGGSFFVQRNTAYNLCSAPAARERHRARAIAWKFLYAVFIHSNLSA